MTPSGKFVEDLLGRLPDLAVQEAIAESAARLVSLQMVAARPDHRAALLQCVFARAYRQALCERLADAAGIHDIHRRRVLRHALEDRTLLENRVDPDDAPPLHIFMSPAAHELPDHRAGLLAGEVDAGQWLQHRASARGLRDWLHRTGHATRAREQVGLQAAERIAALGDELDGRLRALRSELGRLRESRRHDGGAPRH